MLALLITIMIAAIMIGLMKYDVPTNNNDIFVFMAGQVTGAWMLALGYYYSTTSGSKNKDELIAANITNRSPDESN